jgi:Zn-dependent protease
MDATLVLKLFNAVILVILCLTVHEYAHALVARWLGDDTAERQGRLTLDPTKHIDPIGTLLMPALGVIFPGAPIFGWAKPVPTIPLRYSRKFFGKRVTMNSGMAMVAAAGPLSNLLLAVVIALGLGLAMRLGAPGEAAVRFTWTAISINLGLLVFNLIPIPPLDGSRILAWLLPTRYQASYEQLAAYSGLLLVALLMFGGSVISAVFAPVASAALWVVGAVAGG